MDISIPKEIVKEFDKVLIDLLKVSNDTSSYRAFNFCRFDIYNLNFNYDLLEDYLLNVLKTYHVVEV